MRALLLAVVLVSGSAYADAGPKTVKVKYAGTDERGVVSKRRMNDFISSTNKLLLGRGLTVAIGDHGVEEVSPEGVRVRLVDSKGKTSTGLVKTQLMSTNVAISPQAAEWNLATAVEVRIKK